MSNLFLALCERLAQIDLFGEAGQAFPKGAALGLRFLYCHALERVWGF